MARFPIPYPWTYPLSPKMKPIHHVYAKMCQNFPPPPLSYVLDALWKRVFFMVYLLKEPLVNLNWQPEKTIFFKALRTDVHTDKVYHTIASLTTSFYLGWPWQPYLGWMGGLKRCGKSCINLIPTTKLIIKNHETYTWFTAIVGGQYIVELTIFLSAVGILL